VRDKKLKLDDGEASHTLGGAGEGGTQGEESGECLVLLVTGGSQLQRPVMCEHC
jgi:hypothetical protein